MLFFLILTDLINQAFKLLGYFVSYINISMHFSFTCSDSSPKIVKLNVRVISQKGHENCTILYVLTDH